MAPLLSVVVPTRNRPALLGEALASVAGQDIDGTSVEVIVVNDGGVEVGDTVRARRDLGLNIRLLTLPRRLGLPAARNAGIESADGDHIAFLDDDDVFLPHHLGTALKALDDGEADAVYTTCLVSPRRVNPSLSVDAIPHRFGYAYRPDLLTVCNYIPVHSLVFRRLPSGARFDPRLPVLEDWDMWLRLTREHGFRLRHVPEPTVIYHRVPDHASMTSDASTQAAALNRFGDLLRTLWQRWPPATPKAARFRAYLGILYWHTLARLATSRPVSPFYYERSVRALFDAWTGSAPEDGLIERLATAVEEDTDAPDHQ